MYDPVTNPSGIRLGSNEIDGYRDFNINVGGPIKKDKVWWYFSYRNQKNEVAQPNFRFDKTFDTELWNASGKGTYQVNQNNKLIGYYQWGQKMQPNRLPVAASVLQHARTIPGGRIQAAGSTRASGTARSATGCMSRRATATSGTTSRSSPIRPRATPTTGATRR